MISRNTKIFLLLLVSLLVLALVGTACDGAAQPETVVETVVVEKEAEAAEQTTSDEVVEITWLQWWVNEWGADLHAQLIADFEAQHPNIKVKVVDIPFGEMLGKLTTSATGGGDVYDVYGTSNAWIAAVDKQGYIENLDSWLESDPEFTASLTANAPIKYLGHTKHLCLYLIPYHFAYNVDIFEEKGLEPPTNWDELVTTLEALRDPSSGTYGMSLPLKDASFIMTRLFGFRLAQEGGQWFDEDGNIIFNSPEGVAALQWWKDLYDQELIVPDSLGEDQNQMMEFLGSGQTAAAFDGPFIWTRARAIDPDIRMAFAPPWTDKTGGYSWACSGIGMSARSEHKAEAWEFVKYLYSDEVSLKMTEAVSLVWATNASVALLEDSDDPLLKYVPAMANQDPAHNVFYPVLPEASKLMDAFLLAFQETMTGGKEPQTALDEAAAVWQEELDKVK